MAKPFDTLDLFEYSDLRAFLKAYVDARKRQSRGWSLRVWANQLGLSSSATLSMLVSGKRNLGPKLEDRLIKYFNFPPTEKKYFSNLLRMADARRDQSLVVLLQNDLKLLRNTRDQANPAPSSVAEQVLTWHFFVLREMTLLKEFSESREWQKRALRFELSDLEITSALDTLLQLGFLKRDATGKLVPSEGKFVPGSSALQPQTFQRYHAEMLELSQQALGSFSPEDKGFFSSTITCSQAKFIEAKERIQRFQKELSELLEDGAAGDATYVFNFQAFMAAKTPPDGH